MFTRVLVSVSEKASFESIRCFLYSFLEERPWNNSVDYDPAAVGTTALSLPPPLITTLPPHSTPAPWSQ